MKFYKEKFRSIRKRQGLSSEALSNIANISRQSISKWENGKSIPSFKKIQQLAKVLGVNASEISDITGRRKQDKHAKAIEYAISKLKETIWVARGINVNHDTPALFKELLYLNASTFPR